MTRVIHTGDTHVGYRQYHSPERQRDFLAAFEAVVADAIDGDVDAVVHAGDLFHDRRPGLQDLQGCVAALRDLRDADVPFLAVVGNHESKRDGQWLDLFADLGLAERLDETPRRVGDTAFYGLDFVPRSQRDSLAYDFEDHDATHAVLVAHGLFEPFAHADWDTETLLDSSSVEFDAVLLGDNHAPGVERVADAWVTYCGSTERASASERDDRGYNIVAFDADEKAASTDDVGAGVAISRRGLQTRPFVFVDVDLRAGEGVDRVREAVRQYDAEDAVVIVTITGDGEPVTPAPVEELALDDGALAVRVNDHRDATATDDVDVTFADPDAAVSERVRELGLSTAARDIDETVRASDVADSNVRDVVTDRISELVDEDALDAFEPAPDDATAPTGDGDAQPPNDDDTHHSTDDDTHHSTDDDDTHYSTDDDDTHHSTDDDTHHSTDDDTHYSTDDDDTHHSTDERDVADAEDQITAASGTDTGSTQAEDASSVVDGESDPVSDGPSREAEPTPDDTDSTPDDTDSTPDDTDSTPDDTDSTPDDRESTPDDTDSTPDDADSKPDDTSPTPDDKGSSAEDSEPASSADAESGGDGEGQVSMEEFL